MAGKAERVVGVRRQGRSNELRRGRRGQRGWSNGSRGGVSQQLGQHGIFILQRPYGRHDGHGSTFEAPDEVREPAQRCFVGPLEIVDRDQERARLGEVEGQPVEPVEDRERGVLARRRLAGELIRLEKVAGVRSRALEELRSFIGVRLRQERLEELAHHAEGEGALDLAATAGEHGHLGVRCPRTALGQQRRLADARRPFDHGKAAVAGDGIGDHSVDRRQLLGSLEQNGSFSLPRGHPLDDTRARLTRPATSLMRASWTSSLRERASKRGARLSASTFVSWVKSLTPLTPIARARSVG